MFSYVQPDAWVCLRLPSDTLKVVQVTPNTTISLGKYGAFQSNLILGRPYHLTYEIQDRKEGSAPSLRVVPASEIHADTIAEEEAASNPTSDSITLGGDGVQFELVNETGEVVMRSNRETIDDAARQKMTMEEIEILKRDGTDAGKDLIAKLMLSHTALDEKTAFSLAKYKLLKTKKYLRQFTILPLDVPMLTHWLVDQKDAARILEIRNEVLALVGCWANVHFSGDPYGLPSPALSPTVPGQGRWLVVDEIGGLLVASMAERMGILHASAPSTKPPAPATTTTSKDADEDDESSPHDYLSRPPSGSNTITLIHANAQPNMSLLKYFDHNPDTPSPSHPLTTHLHTISWLQLLDPTADTTYSTPLPSLSPAELATLKSGKRGQYFKKRRRLARVSAIVDSTRAGSFDGLAIAAYMDPLTILPHLIPLLRGGAPVAIYSPNVEPLTRLADCYSTSRRAAFVTAPPAEGDLTNWPGNEDFPLNPTLLLGVGVQTSRVREWQVLPGRTHPLMTSRGGAEGYVFTGTRVIPVEGKVEARGNYKRRKTDGAKSGEVSTVQTPAVQTPDVIEQNIDDIVMGQDVDI
ncbi:hypothetical protein V493_04039 [Pseudogymnoascus sp. VKM F-4281 (FW-2241)]|nr:hypothetical protein V493_04039 [Pseudogymnoascus sp. VKM F-4281 (FW-2241)]